MNQLCFNLKVKLCEYKCIYSKSMLHIFLLYLLHLMYVKSSYDHLLLISKRINNLQTNIIHMKSNHNTISMPVNSMV